MLTAGRELWGDHGWAAVTMRGVCARANLNDRYFYESFPDVEALLLAVYDEALQELVARTERAMTEAPATPEAQLRAVIGAFVHTLADDPRGARIGLVDPAGSAALEQRRRATYHVCAELSLAAVKPYLRPGADERKLRWDALFSLGGLGELVLTWLTGSLEATAEEIVEHLVTVVLRVGIPHLRELRET
ncbi:transcriptional regulator, TetR family [Cryptosporangium aurantiacum]|uniref:Transcriptional regulator, TetR family n=1 Tax=Cryptosporangium aurantiacum TaxID=134849 RepID=A0A1M7RD13_9ACTN|nr:transcriptional regulator, TetR family [Cryptosporangium aurantiacum]